MCLRLGQNSVGPNAHWFPINSHGDGAEGQWRKGQGEVEGEAEGEVSTNAEQAEAKCWEEEEEKQGQELK